MKTDRLHRDLAWIDDLSAPDLRTEIAQRLDAEEPGYHPPSHGPRTRVGRTVLVLGVTLSVVAGVLVLARYFPDSEPARDRTTAPPDLAGAIVLGVTDASRQTRLYAVAADGSGATPVAGLAGSMGGRDPSVSPDGSQVVFVRADRDDAGLGIWIQALDGGQPVRIAESPVNADSDPAWSPDGSTIVFSRNRAGHTELFTIAPDGSGLRQLTTNDVGGDFLPAWSPDGTKIVFTRNSGGPLDLWVVDASGGEPSQLTHFDEQGSGAPAYPSWSPDGGRVVFTAAAPDAPELSFRPSIQPSDLWVIGADGSHLVQLTTTPNDEIAPRWSPDGSSIVFLQSVDVSPSTLGPGLGEYRLVLYDVASGSTSYLDAPTGGLTDLTLQWVAGAAVSPAPPPLEEPRPSQVVEATCTANGRTRLSASSVEVQADGVHVRATNESAEPMYLLGLPGGPEHDVAPGATVDVIWDTVVPGEIGVVCYPPTEPDQGSRPLEPLEVLDPEGLYVPAELECPSEGQQSLTSDYIDTPGGDTRPLVDVVEQGVTGILPDDVVRSGGYPAASGRRVIVVRQGAVLGVYYFDPGDVGWNFRGSDVCQASGLAPRPEYLESAGPASP